MTVYSSSIKIHKTWVYSTAGPEERKTRPGEAEETDDALDTDDTEGEPAAGNDTTASNSMLKTIYRSHQNKAVATNGSTPATNGFNDMESLYSNVAEEFDEEPMRTTLMTVTLRQLLVRQIMTQLIRKRVRR